MCIALDLIGSWDHGSCTDGRVECINFMVFPSPFFVANNNNAQKTPRHSIRVKGIDDDESATWFRCWVAKQRVQNRIGGREKRRVRPRARCMQSNLFVQKQSFGWKTHRWSVSRIRQFTTVRGLRSDDRTRQKITIYPMVRTVKHKVNAPFSFSSQFYLFWRKKAGIFLNPRWPHILPRRAFCERHTQWTLGDEQAHRVHFPLQMKVK